MFLIFLDKYVYQTIFFFFVVFVLDINECYNINSCSQICTNEIGSFKCSCTDGYEVNHKNPKHCESKLGRGFLLLGRKNEIRKLSLSRPEVTKIINNLNYVAAMDFDYSTETLFWFDFLDDKIYKYSKEIFLEFQIILMINNC